MAVNALCEVDKLYDIASIEAKRYLVGILFPEKMTYVEGHVEPENSTGRWS
ncbi:hypothetical protein NPE20_00335 [Mucilaginibacter sp. JC4]|uniref:Uncharacterized protein n=1 Tax=Mucilaginibacter aquariorum TaxID=2967225 RepID=A0ABT1SXC1_9SPHI|nr:hypothetical protein [Mucilaginibacter aquariorum]